MNDGFQLSPDGEKLIKHFESCLAANGDGTFRPYLDPVGILTIGWGHTNHHGRRFTASSRWTQAECDASFEEDMQGFEETVKRLVTVPLSHHQFDALVSFSYNCGEGALGRSTLLRKLNRGDYDGAANEFSKWCRGGGRILRGLVRRRAAETMLFQDGHNPTVQALAKAAEPEGMPQQVDAPEPPKSMAASKTGGAALVVGGITATELAGKVTEHLDQLTDIKTKAIGLGLHVPDLSMLFSSFGNLNTLTLMIAIGACGFIWFDRRKKLHEDQV